MTIEKLPFATLMLLLLFLCGSLYLVGFWTTFNLNVSNFISFSDIPKSFVLPLISSFGFMMVQYIVYNNVLNTDGSPLLTLNVQSDKYKSFWRRKLEQLRSPRVWVYITFLVAASTYLRFKDSYVYWFTVTEIFSMFLWAWFIRDELVRKQFPDQNLRMIVGYLVIWFPVLSFGSGKIDSTKIMENENVRVFSLMTDTTSKKIDTLKIISLFPDKLIASSIDNKKIYIINQSLAAKIELFDLDISKKAIRKIATKPTVPQPAAHSDNR